MYLNKIIKHKKSEVASLKLLDKERMRGIHDPAASLREHPFIAEIKMASPSMGEINSSIIIAEQARIYERGGAGAISVLTDEKYFRGSFDFLDEAGSAVTLPLLCKDFIISEIQIENAYLSGADFILLIAAVLNEKELDKLSKKAASMNLEVLYEIHELSEFDRIKSLDLHLVGVNSRNLKTFEIDLKAAGNTIKILKTLGPFMIIAESGISTAEDVRLLKNSGADAFLIGTALMKSGDPAEKLSELYAGLF